MGSNFMRIPFRRTFSLLPPLYGRYKRYAVILFILGILGGLLESFGVSILIPLFSHVSQISFTGGNAISRFFEWFFSALGLEMQLRILLPLIFAVFVVRAAVLLLFDWLRGYLTSDFERTTRADVYGALLNAPWKYIVGQKVGFAENTLMVDITASTRLLSDLTNAMLHVSSLIVYTVFAILINPTVAAGTLVAGFLLLFLFQPFLARTRRYGAKTLAMNKVVAHHINEIVPGMKTIKALGAESYVLQRASGLFDRLRVVRIRQTLMKAITTVAIQPVAVLFVLALFVFLFLKGDFDFAVFAITIFLIDRIFIYIDRAQNLLHVIADSIPYAEHIVSLKQELLAYKTDVTKGALFSFSKYLAFEHVSFSYPGKPPVLSDISLSIQKGAFYALIGKSGAGKTTVVDLMLKLLQPSSGRILLDQALISDIAPSAWHAKVGYVAQEPFLINGTVEENIRFYDDRVTDTDIEFAVSAAGLSSVIAKLPAGIKSAVGERGNALSGGERQRVALARVLARRPELLILDEPTSALDASAEMVIRDALLELRGAITIVIIAHKIDTVRAADRVVVISDGGVIEEGAPSVLLTDPNSQFSRFFKGGENAPMI